VLCCILWKKGRSEGTLGALFFQALFISAGALRYGTADVLPSGHIGTSPFFGRRVALKGRVTESYRTESSRMRAVVEVEELEGGKAEGKILVSMPRGSPPPPGSEVEVYGRLRRPGPARNPGAPDGRALLERRGIYALLYADRLRVASRGSGIPAIRAFVRRALELDLPSLHAGVLKGLILGERREAPRWLQDAFARSGTAHILAVSGLHTGFIAAFLFFLFGFIGVPRRVTVGLTIVLLVLYAFLVDLRPSVVRAVVLASLILMGILLERDLDLLNGLGAAALVLLAFRPRDLLDVSFQLSFAAVAGIALFYSPLYVVFSKILRGKLLGKVAALMAVSICAQVGAAPIVAYHFGRLSLIGPLTNLLAVPMAGWIVALGLLTAISYPLWAALASAWNGANYLLISGLVALARWASHIPFASVNLPRPPPPLLLGYTGVILSLSSDTRWRPNFRKIVLFLGLAFLNFWAWGQALRPGELEVTFLDVGQGDAVFLSFPNRRTMLVDGGPRSPGYDAGERVLLPFLRYRGVSRLDLVVATHPDNDHIGGLLSVLERVPVGYLIEGDAQGGGWTYRRLRGLAREKGIPRIEVEAGDSLVGLGGVGILVLGPPKAFVREGDAIFGANNASVVLRVTYGEFSLLLTGDAERLEESYLLRWGERIRAKVLKLGHHGAPSSSSPPFLEAVYPEVAVISVGTYNPFGHPSPEVLDRLRTIGSRVLRTDRMGAVLFRVRQGRWRVCTML